MPLATVVDLVIDWRRLRAEALEPLVRGHSARFARYDWDAHDGRLSATTSVPATDLVVVEGVYSARPELADLVNLTVYVDVAPEVRRRRLQARNYADDPEWVELWERGEEHYFTEVRPPERFALRVSAAED